MTKLRLFVILSLWRSIHKFKVCLKFFGFFAVACALQPVGSLISLTQNDKSAPSLR